MKKKITLALVLILLVVLCATIFAGCDEIFSKNQTRDETQVVATITYNGQTTYVYKFELEQSFNNYAYYYTYYYSMSYEEAADYILKSLAQQKLLVLYATEQICNKKGVAVTSDIASLLTASELNHAIVEVNDSLLDSLKTIVENAITEDNYNAGTEEEEEEEVVIADDAKTIYVRFNSQGGSDVDKQQLKAGAKAKEPDEPTKDGYKFYGWYEDLEDANTKIDFSSRKFTATTTLFAKWVEYIEPRTVKTEEEEEDDYDPEDETVTLSDKFFTDAYQATVYAEFEDEDFVSDMKVAEGADFKKVLETYISDGLATLKKNMTTNLYKNSYEEAYNYYLNAQYETIIVEKYERMVGDSVAVPTEADVIAEYNRLVQSNKETYSKSISSYESALKSSLSTTYYNNFTAKAGSSYGFVNNILLKLSDEQVEELEQMLKENPANKKAVEIARNRMIEDMEVYVSNPSYYNGDDTSKIDKENEDNDIELVDPMTDPNNKYNNIAADGTATKTPDTTYQKEGGNDYTQIISFEKNAESGEYEIVYNATEAPNMAYLLNKVKVFGTNGIIDQIQVTFEQVNAATDLNKIQKAYWLRQVATEWLYLVGDDSGSLSTDSNNNGLGYLITPEDSDTSYLADFTDYARELIKQGTGSYNTGSINVVDVVNADGSLAHNKECYVVADSFIENGTTSGGYAGVFVLLCSYKVWDESLYSAYTNPSKVLDTPADGAASTLPMDYILTFAADEDDIETIYGVIYNSLLDSKKADAYSVAINTMGATYADNISYNKKAYKSLYEDLED